MIHTIQYNSTAKTTDDFFIRINDQHFLIFGENKNNFTKFGSPPHLHHCKSFSRKQGTMTEGRETKPKSSRIPLALQAVFLASNRGKEVNQPPPDKSASKVFFGNWLFQRRGSLGRKQKTDPHGSSSPAKPFLEHSQTSDSNEYISLPIKEYTVPLKEYLVASNHSSRSTGRVNDLSSLSSHSADSTGSVGSTDRQVRTFLNQIICLRSRLTKQLFLLDRHHAFHLKAIWIFFAVIGGIQRSVSKFFRRLTAMHRLVFRRVVTIPC